MKEHFIITLRVFDKYFRLKINRKDEKKYRDAAVAIEKKTNQYRNYFSGSGSEHLQASDYLTMTAIQALSETEGLEAENKMFEDKVQSLIDELDEYLKKSK
jgi:cell division protein ZapA (FtsZ GTPase activity inhibitor)